MESEMNKCVFCGAELVHESEMPCNEISDYDEDDSAVCYYMSCPRCGRFYEIWEPKREEREKDYKEYWGYGDNG